MLQWHPTQPWVLASAPETYSIQTYISKDSGETWATVATNILQFGWGDAGKIGVPETRIYMIVNQDSPGEQIPYNFIYTDDFGGTTTLIEARCYQFVFLPKQLFIVVV
jgi:hypothetical protein